MDSRVEYWDRGVGNKKIYRMVGSSREVVGSLRVEWRKLE